MHNHNQKHTRTHTHTHACMHKHNQKTRRLRRNQKTYSKTHIVGEQAARYKQGKKDLKADPNYNAHKLARIAWWFVFKVFLIGIYSWRRKCFFSVHTHKRCYQPAQLFRFYAIFWWDRWPICMTLVEVPETYYCMTNAGIYGASSTNLLYGKHENLKQARAVDAEPEPCER